MDTTLSTTPTPPAKPAASPAPPKPRPVQRRDEILFVGMNKDAVHEVVSLRKSTNVPVVAILGGREQGALTIRHQGKLVRCDLRTESGAATFVASLRLPEEQSAKLRAIFKDFSVTEKYTSHQAGDALDELALIARVWAQAERGGHMPTRMVLSGHNTGSGIWGDDNGKLSFEMLERLADAMPTAARKVEDLHLSACYSGGETLMNRYQAIFPNAKTVWAYGDSAPGSYSGATAHLNRWERATRGSRAELDRDIAAKTRKGENVTVWTSSRGYQDGQAPEGLDARRQRVETSSRAFAGYFSGSQAVGNPGQGPLREYYSAMQRLLQSADLPAAERPDLEAKKDQTIRLLFYTKSVAPKFAAKHGEAIKAGYEALGLAVPDFAKLSRADAMARIAEFETALDAPAAGKHVPEAAKTLRPLLVDGLKALTSDLIPETWV
jgi:hypothetical protein